jgi:glycosyltransferase involved in cell wall biosynthesis
MYLGRLSHKKGLDVLVRAFAGVRRDVPDAMLAIVGPDDEQLEWPLRALAASEFVENRVVFTGMLTGDDKLAALAAADVWALPSRGENFGNAVVEAMAASRACVISPEVNIAPEIAAAGAASIIERTPEAFAAEIAALLRDDACRHALGASARDFARRYDWTNVAPRMAEMYEQIARAA